MVAESERQTSAEIEVTPAMVAAFQGAYLAWERSSKGWSYSLGLQRILEALLRDAEADVRSIVCKDRHEPNAVTRHEQTSQAI